jgi:hypothetical protein
LGKTVGGGQGKKKYPVRQGRVCSVHRKWSETRYIYEICVVPLHKWSCFENITPWNIIRPSVYRKHQATSQCMNYNTEI